VPACDLDGESTPQRAAGSVRSGPRAPRMAMPSAGDAATSPRDERDADGNQDPRCSHEQPPVVSAEPESALTPSATERRTNTLV